MAASSYPRAFDEMIRWEGSRYTNHKADRGGPTKYGVTQATLSRWLKAPATPEQVKALTLDAVKPIYKAFYANAVRFDDLPPGLDYLAFDLAVNSGQKRAADFLQDILNITVDGYIGPATIRAAWAAFNRDRKAIVNAYVDRRERFLAGIIANDPSQAVFRKGWFNRTRAARAVAVEMATGWRETATVTPSTAPAAPPPPAQAPQPPKPGFWQRFTDAFMKRLGG